MDVVRSMWEESIEEYIKGKYPALRIESNDRSIIPSRQTRSFNLEIDIFIPELSLGIEANGEQYHDRETYLKDSAYGTVYSDEMYKEHYCKRVGIELIHVWSSEDMETIQSRIDRAIQGRLADPATKEWQRPTWTSRLGLNDRDVAIIVMIGAPALLATCVTILDGGDGEWLVWLWVSIIVGGVFYRWGGKWL